MYARKEAKWSLTLARVLALIVVIGLSVSIFLYGDEVKRYAIYGYPGIFIIAFAAYATVILPAPGVAIVFAAGAILHPLGVGLAAGAGAALGELVGYLAGFSGQAVIEKAKTYERLIGWMRRNGSITIFILAMVPNPVFDVVGIIAGALKMPVLKFLFWCFLGETLKMTALAYLGATAITHLR